jgi:hypothetical protein
MTSYNEEQGYNQYEVKPAPSENREGDETTDDSNDPDEITRLRSTLEAALKERDEAIKEREEVWAINQDLASDAELMETKRTVEKYVRLYTASLAHIEKVREVAEWARADSDKGVYLAVVADRLDRALADPAEKEPPNAR